MTKEEIAAKLRKAADYMDAGDLRMAGRLAASCVDDIDALRYPSTASVTATGSGNTVVQTDHMVDAVELMNGGVNVWVKTVWINGERVA